VIALLRWSARRLRCQLTEGVFRPLLLPQATDSCPLSFRAPAASTMLIEPAIASARWSAVGARMISTRSTISGVSESRSNPAGAFWPLSRIWV